MREKRMTSPFFLIILLMVTVVTALGPQNIRAEGAQQKAPKSQSPTNKDFAVLFSTIKYAGSYVFLQSISGRQTGVDLAFLKVNYDIEEKTELPKVELERNFLKFAGLKKKLDLSKLHLGEIYDGNSYFKFHPGAPGAQEFARLVNYLQETETRAESSPRHRLRELFIETAHADPDPATVEKAKVAAIIAGGVYASAIATSVATSGSIGTAFATGAIGAGATTIGGIILWAGVAESAIKYGIRRWRGHEVVCENGNLYIKSGDGKMESLDSPQAGAFKDAIAYFSHADIGAAELAVQKLICSDSKARDAINTGLDKAFEGATLGPAGAHKNKLTQ